MAHGRGRHFSGDDVAREVRLAIRERAGRAEIQADARLQDRDARVILVGELSLWVALLMTAWAAATSFAGGALGRDDLVTTGRRGLYATCAMIILASIGLWHAPLTHAFSLT